MNNTLIESINKLTQIKSDLNDILVENGIPSSNILTDYPDKFRELFRVTNIYTSGTLEGIEDTEVISNPVVVDPVMSVYQNIVTITCPTDEATIYYWIVTDSGNNNIGVGPLTGKTVVCTESCTVWCYAQYREDRSNNVWVRCEVQQIVVPEPPRITREGTTVTIEKFSDEDTIYYTLDGVWNVYTDTLTVPRTSDVYAYTANWRGRSIIITDEAPEKPIAPAKPSISFYHNVVTITCDTQGAELYYRKYGTTTWFAYSQPFEITATATYEAKAVKNGINSNENATLICTYVPKPVTPTVVASNNKVYISCDTVNAKIYYKIGSGSYIQYTSPINLSTTITLTAKATLDWQESDEITTTCTYVNPSSLVPAVPIISCSDNVVTMSCSTTNATIKYRIYGSGSAWTTYTGPFEISATAVYEAYATKNGYDSDPCSPATCTYVEPSQPTAPANPVFSISDNKVTITCSTINAVIYYRKADGSSWITYTGPISISENTTFVAVASKNGLDSNQVVYNATYVPEPVVVRPNTPVITCNMNVVSITCSTSGATIYYSIDYSNFIPYNGSFEINSDITVQAYSILNGLTSDVNTTECIYLSNYYLNEYLTIVSAANLNTIKWNASNSSFRKTISISTDNGNTWVDKTSDNINGTILAVLNSGDKILIKGNNEAYAQLGNFYFNYFSSTDIINVEGNIMSLIYGDNFIGNNIITKDVAFAYLFNKCEYLRSVANLILPATTLKQGCYTSMFYECTSLVNSPASLPATTLENGCYSYMFYGCTSLTTAPSLPATTLEQGCYSSMFEGCTSLVNIPASLPATTLFYGCYSSMFKGCTSLSNTPELPATTLAQYCYDNMFSGCTSLTTAPSLSATTLAQGCYYSMFEGCTSLVNAPELPATTLEQECYTSMFQGCISLVNAPELPATTLVLSCYFRMFNGCTSLNYVKCMATTNIIFYGEAGRNTWKWLENVSSTGLFIKASGINDWPSNINGIPEGWTV